jgi:threonine aldolase
VENKIDLRSDTVTLPSPGMREAMASAEVGDDVYGEDPTVNALQAVMAKVFGKEAGLFVPSGTMSNQLAIKSHTRPGDEVIVEADSHSFQYETAGPAFISQVQIYPIKGRMGMPDTDEVIGAIRPDVYYFPHTALICLENTHNRSGGCVLPIDGIRELRRGTRERGVPLHLDGARIWNAHVATGVSLEEYASQADSISVCFSKGLGAPVGSMLLGPRGFIQAAHKFRKILGGGMRQAGILAAAARYAFDNNLERLKEDHRRARAFAEALSRNSAFEIDPLQVQTNMVLLRFTGGRTAAEAQRNLETEGILIGQSAQDKLRAVFHLGISDVCTDRAIEVFKRLFA